jgi:drug/metabolite transporter (DMT)-like permease
VTDSPPPAAPAFRDPTAERRALLEMALSAVCFGGMAFAAKMASSAVPGAQIATIRFLIGLLPFLVVPALLRKAAEVKRWDLLFYRGFFGGVAVLCYFLAIAHIPVGYATLFNYSSPIWSSLFAWGFLGEKLRRATFLPLLVALAGVSLVAVANQPEGEPFAFGLWEGLGIASSILSGAALAAIRASRRSENSWAIFGSFGLLGLLATAPFAWATWVTPTAGQWFWLAACGLLALAAQLLMTHAYRWIDNVRAGAIAQLAVAVAMGLGVVVLGDRLTPLGVAGSILTIAGVVATLTLDRTGFVRRHGS